MRYGGGGRQHREWRKRGGGILESFSRSFVPRALNACMLVDMIRSNMEKPGKAF